jgi:hypothetical protein
MKLYISGSITAPTPTEQADNLLRFHEVAERLRKDGHDVFNPAELEVTGATWEYYLTRDLVWIYEHRPTLYLLNGWEKSRGARLEVELAKLLGLPLINEE